MNLSEIPWGEIGSFIEIGNYAFWTALITVTIVLPTLYKAYKVKRRSS